MPSVIETEIAVGPYLVAGTERILTPALLIYRELVEQNIHTTIRLLEGNPKRWRPHVKTAKLEYVMALLVEHGVHNFKCATTLELLTAIKSGATDVLVAYPLVGASAWRTRTIADQHPHVAISVLVDNLRQLKQWRGSCVGIFVDVNPGMNRTGIEQEHTEEIVRLAHQVRELNLLFRGLHYYDGHLGSLPLNERTSIAHANYDRLMKLVGILNREGLLVEEVITAGTPAFPCTLSYTGFASATFHHSASPGTVVYGDATSLQQLPPDFGYMPACLVLSRVVSRPTSTIITCDAGHKTLSVDAGVPNCIVAGNSRLNPLQPSEEHLPMEILDPEAAPELESLLYLIPRHVCPTVNNFDFALLIANGRIARMEPVSARGREAPLLG